MNLAEVARIDNTTQRKLKGIDPKLFTAYRNFKFLYSHYNLKKSVPESVEYAYKKHRQNYLRSLLRKYKITPGEIFKNLLEYKHQMNFITKLIFSFNFKLQFESWKSELEDIDFRDLHITKQELIDRHN